MQEKKYCTHIFISTISKKYAFTNLVLLAYFSSFILDQGQPKKGGKNEMRQRVT